MVANSLSLWNYINILQQKWFANSMYLSFLVTILAIQMEVCCILSEQKLDLNEYLEEKQDWNETKNGKPN